MLDLNVTHNLPDFKRQMARFGQDFERRTVRSATLAAANVFKKLVIAAAPVLRRPSKKRIAGALKKSIYVYRSKRSTKGAERYVVSFRKGRKAAKTGRDAFYGRFLEAGWIPRGPGKGLRGGKRSKALQRSRSAGGKITQYKFIGPGFARGRAAALAAFNKRISTRIAKESRKV